MLRTTTLSSILAISLCCQALAQQDQPDSSVAPAITHHTGYAIVKPLEKKVELEFVETPLVEVVEFLRSEHRLPIVLDKASLDVVGIDPEEIVDFQAKDSRLVDALNIICRGMELAVVPEDSLLVVTTLEEAEVKTTIANYPVWDLVVDPGNPQQADYDSLIELITMSVAPETWEDVGGTGSIVGHKGILSISQDFNVHQQVARLIDGLRELPTSVVATKTTAPVAIPTAGSWVNQYEKQLDALVLVEYVDTPLAEIVSDIRERYKLPLRIDAASLEAAGIDTAEPVSAGFPKVKLATVLDRVLGALDLTYAISDGFITIMTVEESEQRLETRIYPVAGIVDDVDTGRADYHSLIELVHSIVSPETWEEVGGTGTIVAYPSRACLVVSQSNDVHKQLQKQLSDLHLKYRDKNAAPKIVNKIPDDKIVTHVYMIPTRDSATEESAPIGKASKNVNAQFGGGGLGGGGSGGGRFGGIGEIIGGGIGGAFPGTGGFVDRSSELKPVAVDSLEILIMNEIATGSWSKTPNARISTLPDRLMVRHSHKVHKEIQDLLDKLFVPVLNPYGDPANALFRGSLQNKGFGGGFGGGGGGFGGGGGGFFNLPDTATPDVRK